MKLSQSVGNNAVNNPNDVAIVQRLLNRSLRYLTPLQPLRTDNNCGPITVGMIVVFQRRVVKMKNPDGRVDRDGSTFDYLLKADQQKVDNKEIDWTIMPSVLLLKVQSLLKKIEEEWHEYWKEDISKPQIGLTDQDYQKAANQLGVEVNAIKAVAHVESRGKGFLPSGKPKILFEGHIFHRQTNGAHSMTNPTISHATWTRQHYKGGEEEYTRLNKAISLDKTAALKSASWGRFQIMGFNHTKAGYANVDGFVKAMEKSDTEHLLTFVNFVNSEGLKSYIKNKDWAGFARKYNGPKYEENGYDTKMAQAYEAFSAK